MCSSAGLGLGPGCFVPKRRDLQRISRNASLKIEPMSSPTCGICRRGRGQVVLEEHIVLVRNTANATEHVASHEVVSVGAESINDLHISVSRDTHA